MKLAIRDVQRPVVSVSIDRRTKARIDLLVRLTGKSRGQIVDMALDALDVCGTCQGTGEAYEPGAFCPDCNGHKVVPR
jgi:DnaJ-class molecular chaperone